MREPITITATLPAWITASRGVEDVLSFVRSGQQEAAVSALYFCTGNMDEGKDPWVRAGEADITVRLLSHDDLLHSQLQALRADLEAARAAWLTKQQQILEQISKLQALTNEVQG